MSLQEGLTKDEIELLAAMKDGKDYTNDDLQRKLGWSDYKVKKNRDSLQKKGLLSAKKEGRIFYYALIFTTAASFLILYGIMNKNSGDLKRLILREQSERISGDQYLEGRLTTTEGNFVAMINMVRKENDLNYIETMNLITALQNKDMELDATIMRNYNLTQQDINSLRTQVNLNDLYYKSQFESASLERGYLASGLTQEQYERQILGQRVGGLEAEVGYQRQAISDILTPCNSIFNASLCNARDDCDWSTNRGRCEPIGYAGGTGGDSGTTTTTTGKHISEGGTMTCAADEFWDFVNKRCVKKAATPLPQLIDLFKWK